MIMLTRQLAILVVLSLLAVACGQHDGVRESVAFRGAQPGAEGDPDAFDDPDFDPGMFDDDGTGDPGFDPDTGEPFDPGTGDPGTAAPGTAGPTRTAPGAGPAPPAGESADPGQTGQQQQQAQQQQQGAGDSTGIDEGEIRIGVHAPLTGAAPLPQPEFRSGSVQYWQHHGQVHGRDVRIIVRDDRYNPSHATSVCNDLIQREQVFTIIGGGGADQIAACARVSAQQGVPYLSAGVDEGALRQLSNYFALSLSYPQQGPMIVQYIMRNHRPDNGRLGILRDRTPGFNNVIQVVQREAERAGLEVTVHQYQSGPGAASWIASNQLEVVFPIMAPSQFVQVVRSPGGASPMYVGVGITMGLNTVANAACQGNNPYQAMFLSPFPGLNQIDRLDPDFREAGGAGDIELALWGLNKTIDVVFDKMQPNNLTREAFVQVLQTERIQTNVYPELRHTAEDHFGAQSAHVLIADCSQNPPVYVTPDDGLFVSGF